MTKNQVKNYQGDPYSLEDVLLFVGPGWHKLVSELIDDLFELGWDGTLDQIKEKFGGLRFYVGESSQAVRDRISTAERLSCETCETCGAPGSLRDGGWVLTLCDFHHRGDASGGTNEA